MSEISEASRLHGIPYNILYQRNKNGFTLEEAIQQGRGRFRDALSAARKEWLAILGWDCQGMSRPDVLILWAETLAKLYQHTTTRCLSRMVGVTQSTILHDLRRFGIKARPKGGANYKGPTFNRVKVMGQEYPSFTDAIQAHGLTVSKVYGRMIRWNCDLHGAIAGNKPKA